MISLEVVLIAPCLGASKFLVGALYQNGVKLDLLPLPPVLRKGNPAFSNSADVSRDICPPYT